MKATRSKADLPLTTFPSHVDASCPQIPILGVCFETGPRREDTEASLPGGQRRGSSEERFPLIKVLEYAGRKKYLKKPSCLSYLSRRDSTSVRYNKDGGARPWKVARLVWGPSAAVLHLKGQMFIAVFWGTVGK